MLEDFTCNMQPPATCFMHAQAYLAGTSIGRELDANERVKIVCGRSKNNTASVQPRSL